MFKRQLGSVLPKATQTLKAAAIIGLRQSGKPGSRQFS
jgi:hypothetical protein